LPASSPHTAHGLPYLQAVLAVSSINLSTAGFSGR
jgi:hypothetical protein